MNKAILLLTVFIATSLFAQKKKVTTTWHHANSPYRAVFEVKAFPTNPKVGGFIEVPSCGMGRQDGSEVFCYDTGDKQLLSQSFGISTNNRSLIQVVPSENTKYILAYFGSNQRSPAIIRTVIPPYLEIYDVPTGLVKNWTDTATRLSHANIIGRMPIQTFEQVSNPVDSRENFICVMKGLMDVKSVTKRNFFIATSGAGYLFVDDYRLIERNGPNNIYNSLRGENRKLIEIQPGVHEIRLISVNFEGPFTAALGEWFSTPKVALVPASDFIQGGTFEFVGVETHQRDNICPAFKYTPVAAMAINDNQMTVMELETYTGTNATWTFSDGIKMQGAKITRVFGDMETVSVKVQCKNASASGKVMFLQAMPPKELSASSDTDFTYIEELIKNQNVRKCTSVGQLSSFMEFFMRRDLHPMQATIAEAILECQKVSPELKGKVLLALARATAKTQPDKALKAYDALLKGQERFTKEILSDILCEAVEYAIFCRRDFEVAEAMLQRCSKTLSSNSKTVLALRYDLALQSGKMDDAGRIYTELLKGRTKAEERRSAAVLANSIQANISMLLQRNQILEAERNMRDWIATSPQDRGNGSYTLARAKCFRKRGWNEGAIAELTAAIKANPMLPNLPDVEYELALAYEDIGNTEMTTKLLQKIAKEYPNHALSAEARKKLANTENK